MNHLHRELAPISDAAWAEIDAEATRTLTHFLTGRRLVEFAGPVGWNIDVGTARARREGQRCSRGHPCPRARAPSRSWSTASSSRVERDQLDAVDRGARDVDLDSVRDAARHLALAEDEAVFLGSRTARDRGDRRRVAPRETPHRRRLRALSRHRRPRRRDACRRPASAGPTPSPSGRGATPA